MEKRGRKRMCMYVQELDFNAFAKPAFVIGRRLVYERRRVGIAMDGGVELVMEWMVSVSFKPLIRGNTQAYPV